MRGAVEDPRLMVSGKIRNQWVLLRRNARSEPTRTLGQLRALEELAAETAGAAELRGIEGTAARLYFEAFPAMLLATDGLPGPAYGFAGRTRRPPTDAVNCLLSFCYGLLTKDTFAALLAVGFDPYIGLFHRPRFGRPALALDLAEEFRPLLADSVTLKLVNTGEAKPTHFLVRAGGVALTAEGRRVVIRAWERRMETLVRHPVFGYRISYRRVIEVQARLLAAALVGEVPRYVPFTTR
jgi:CRISPR-associated protein Cas1